MKIRVGNELGVASSLLHKERELGRKGSELVGSTTGASATEKIDLENTKTLRQQLDLEKMLAERAERVAKIKQEVLSGNYQVNSRLSAAALLSGIGELIGGRAPDEEIG